MASISAPRAPFAVLVVGFAMCFVGVGSSVSRGSKIEPTEQTPLVASGKIEVLQDNPAMDTKIAETYRFSSIRHQTENGASVPLHPIVSA